MYVCKKICQLSLTTVLALITQSLLFLPYESFHVVYLGIMHNSLLYGSLLERVVTISSGFPSYIYFFYIWIFFLGI